MILATGADQHFADAVKAHWQPLFDDAVGSDGVINTIAEEKINALRNRLNVTTFDYIGNSRSDIPVWTKAQKSYITNAQPQLMAQATKAPSIQAIEVITIT